MNTMQLTPNYWGILMYPNASVKPNLLPARFSDRRLADRSCSLLQRQIPTAQFQVLSLVDAEALPLSH